MRKKQITGDLKSVARMRERVPGYGCKQASRHRDLSQVRVFSLPTLTPGSDAQIRQMTNLRIYLAWWLRGGETSRGNMLATAIIPIMR